MKRISSLKRLVFPDWDPWILILTLAATVIGLVFIYDASYPKAMDRGQLIPADFRNHLVGLGVAIFVTAIASRMPEGLVRKLAGWFFLAIFLALVAVEVAGTYQNGAKRWLDLKVFMWQPAETMKLATILYLAAVFADRPRWPKKIPRFKDRVREIESVWIPKAKRMLPGVWVLLAVYLIEHEPDLGTAAVVLAIALVMFMAGGVSRKTLAAVGVITIVGVGFLVTKQSYRMQRFESHFHRWESKVMTNEGFQTVQSEVAMATGHIAGVGMGGGRAKHVMPAASTDFVLATIAEETGFVGVSLVLGVLAALCWRLVRLAEMAKREFTRLVLIGSATWIGVQTATNVMMANGTLPPIGIPIPFISYGGSSLLAMWACIGLTQALVRADQRKAVEEEVVEPGSDGWRYRRPHLPRA